MDNANFQELFDDMKKVLDKELKIEEYKNIKPNSDWLQMREQIKELAKEMCYYDSEAGTLIILACYWSRYRGSGRNSKVDREFFEYLNWMQENPGKTY